MLTLTLWLKRLFFITCLISIVMICTVITLILHWRPFVIEQFSGQKWQVPAKVYARPLELYHSIKRERILHSLQQLNYQPVNSPKALKPGAYFTPHSRQLHVYSRGFDFWDGQDPGQSLILHFNQNRLTQILDTHQQEVAIARLEPELIGGIFPDHREDRILIQLEETPPLLLHGLLLIEDRDFYQHHGVSIKSITRAMISNLKAGQMVQGGSTITQQLVKNFFLTRERTLSRKFKEAIYALILDAHFSKDEILEAYLNEVFLGQSGARAIHGFGLASQHYFRKTIAELAPQDIALLVAIVKGPSYYQPHRRPEATRNRRDLVLQQLKEHHLLDEASFQRAVASPLGVVAAKTSAINRYPAFLDVVQEQLKTDYPQEALTSEGLRIFTTLDTFIQNQTETITKHVLQEISTELETAVVTTDPQTGELLALLGSRRASATGFNRALQAYRPIGSIIKPAVYLAAIELEQYRLYDWLDDSPVTIPTHNGTLWSPENFDRKSHGRVMLQQALSDSYNQATARLGNDIGLDRIAEMLTRLGLQKNILEVPSLVLGSIELSPFEVASLYQTIAARGFTSPIRSILAVKQADGTQLNPYPLAIRQQVSPQAIMLINHALQQVVETGTAKSLQQYFGSQSGFAGKTGTTNDLRDSWFAGMGDNYLSVVWIGHDNNTPTDLTGATGALQLWARIASKLQPNPLYNPLLPGYEYVWLDKSSGDLSDQDCPNTVSVIMHTDDKPQQLSDCIAPKQPNRQRPNRQRSPSSWFKRWLP